MKRVQLNMIRIDGRHLHLGHLGPFPVIFEIVDVTGRFHAEGDRLVRMVLDGGVEWINDLIDLIDEDINALEMELRGDE